MDTFDTVVVGIASSLIATFVFFSLSWYLKNIALPWYTDKIYRGVRIDGRWNIQSIKGVQVDSHLMTFELNQHGDSLKGIYTGFNDARQNVELYNIVGRVRDTYVNLQMWPVSDKELDSGVLLLHLYDGEKALK